MPAPPPPSFDLVIASDDWGRAASAPQHLGAHLARGRQVLWVEPAGLRRPRATRHDLRRVVGKLAGMVGAPTAPTTSLLPVPPTLRRHVPPVAPFFSVPGVGWVLDELLVRSVSLAASQHLRAARALIVTVPTAAALVGRLDERASVYLRMDDFALWPHHDVGAVLRGERSLLAHVDALVAPCAALLQVDEPLGRARPLERLWLPHGVDSDHFAHPGGDPLAALPHPRLLVAGRIDERLDGDWLLSLLVARPDAVIVLLGEPVCVPSILLRHPRVHLRPAVPYSELPTWLHAADVLLVPYRAGRLTDSLAPLKLRELLATGRPVLTTPMRGVEDDPALRAVVRQASREAAADALDALLAEGEAPAELRRASVRDASWSSRAATLRDLVQRLLPSRRP